MLNFKVDRNPNLRCVIADGSDFEVVGKIQAHFRLKNRVIVLDVLFVLSLSHTSVLGVDSTETSSQFSVISEQRAEMDTLVQTYFSSSASDLGCVKGVEHRIDFESKTMPIKLSNFPISPKLQEIIDRDLGRCYAMVLSNLRLRLGLLPSS